MKVVALALLALASQTQATQSRFDLQCRAFSVGFENEEGQRERPTTKLLEQRLILDLTRGVWCNRPCKDPGRLEVSATQFRLSGGPRALGESTGQIDRLTGEYVDKTRLPTASGEEYLVARFSCERRPFSGLPARKF